MSGPKYVQGGKTALHLIRFRFVRSSKINYNFLKFISIRVSVDIWWQNWFNFGRLDIFLPHWNTMILLTSIVYSRGLLVCQGNLKKNYNVRNFFICQNGLLLFPITCWLSRIINTASCLLQIFDLKTNPSSDYLLPFTVNCCQKCHLLSKSVFEDI